MKIRQGYVSNSSSSSFIIVGIHLTDEVRLKIAEKIKGSPLNDEDEAYDFLDKNSNYLSDDGPGYLGKILADVRTIEDCFLDEEHKLEDLSAEALKIIKPFGFTSKDIKLIFGTRSC